MVIKSQYLPKLIVKRWNCNAK